MSEYGKKEITADLAEIAQRTGVAQDIVTDASGIASIVSLIMMSDPTKEGLMKATGAAAIWIDKIVTAKVEEAIKAKSEADALLTKSLKPQNAYEKSLYTAPNETAAALNAASKKGYEA